jgi:molybdopterin/thiamine biosynthesis adenylyltransferase
MSLVDGNVEEILQRDLERASVEMGASSCSLFNFEVAPDAYFPAGRISLDGGLEIIVVANEYYPGFPPYVLVTADGETKQAEIAWSLETPLEDRLLEALRKEFSPPGPYRQAFGPSDGPALTFDESRAQLARWEQFYTAQNPISEAEEIRASLFARSTGLLARTLKDKRVLLVGLGSGGSYIAEQLVRSGVGSLVLVDPDNVEKENLCRTAYDLRDIGNAKTEALARRLLNINPLVELELADEDLLETDSSLLNGWIEESDLILAATDDPAAQRLLNRFSYARDKPAVFGGMYTGAEGGEVIFIIPETTACYLCATSVRHQVESDTGVQVSQELDYGTGRLSSETAISADIHHVTSVAAKVALSLLLPTESEARLTKFLDTAVEDGANYITLSNVEDYWFYPDIFDEGVPGQHAYQSVWLTPTKRDECPVCGLQEHRAPPESVSPKGPDLNEIRKSSTDAES